MTDHTVMMELRDYFAANILASMIARSTQFVDEKMLERWTSSAYRVADMMMEVRKQ